MHSSDVHSSHTSRFLLITTFFAQMYYRFLFVLLAVYVLEWLSDGFKYAPSAL